MIWNILLCFFLLTINNLNAEVFEIPTNTMMEILPQKEKSYSMSDSSGVALDEKIIKLFNFEGGFFIEVGANDGIEQSNTKRLEEFHGWKGILIEPCPSLYQTLVSNRPNSKCYQCALGSFEQDNTYLTGDFNGHPMSSIGGKRLNRPAKYTVLVRSLQSILDEEGISHVHLFSLDVEGYEIYVLNGIDFSKVTFDYMLVEITSHNDEINEILTKNGYELVENFSNYNHIDDLNWDGTHNDYLYKRVER